MKEEAIVSLYWQRDESAIRETEREYGHYLTKIAHNVLSDVEDSRESVNDTYLKAWNSMPPHRPEALSVYLGKSPGPIITADEARELLTKGAMSPRFREKCPGKSISGRWNWFTGQGTGISIICHTIVLRWNYPIRTVRPAGRRRTA